MEILDHLNRVAAHRTGSRINVKILRNSFLFTLASMAGLTRQRFKGTNGEERYVNFFGVTMADIGTGKDTSLDICEEMFNNIASIYMDITKQDYTRLNGPLPNGDGSGDNDVIVPTQWITPLRGSIEGMMRTANFYNNTERGSLNVVSTEFGAEFNKEVIPLLTTLWQSAKAHGSTNVNEKYPPVNDVPTNVLLFGSPKPFRRNEKKHDSLVETIESGFARRAIFVWNDFEDITLSDEEPDNEAITEYAEQIEEYLKRKETLQFTDDAKIRLQEYRLEAINEFNLKKTDINNIKVRSIDLIERTAALVAISELSYWIRPYDVEKAIEIVENSLEDMKAVISPQTPYKTMYEILKGEDTYIGIVEMANHGIRFKNKAEEKYQIEKLDEYAFYKNMKLNTRGSRFKLEELPMTDLNEMIVSTNTEGKGARGVQSKALRIPFLGSRPSIESLVQTGEVDWFTLCHFNGTRSSKNAISGQNMIAFDIDEGMKLEEAVSLLEPYTYIIYTTRNHRVPKNGITVDRFRILLPTKTEFYVDNEQHKKMIDNISKVLQIPSYDVATRNQDRLWFTNSDAQVFTNNGDLLDVSCCIPSTETQETVSAQLGSIDETKLSDDKRIQGMQRYVLSNAHNGRNNMLLRLHRFVVDLTGSKEEADQWVYATNAMLLDPLSEIELQRTVCR